jgi:general secretion pathway protein F
MALFKYKVSDASGKVSTTLIEGDSQSEATRRLQRRGLLPLEFLGEGAAATGEGGGLGLRGRKFDVDEFTDRLVPLLDANVPLERALGIVGEGLDDEFSTEVVGDLRRGLHEGRKLSALIRDRGRMFPNLYANVVEAGEEAGALPQVMSQLRRFLNDARELRAFVVSAAIYPAFVMTAGAVMLSVIIGVIVPRFARILQDAERTPTLSMELLLKLAAFGRGFWWLVPVSIVALVWLVRQTQREGTRLRSWYDEWILKVPLAGQLVLYANLARMCRTMSILMKSGVHLLDTVGIATRVIQNGTLKESVSGLAGELRRGQKLSNALGQSSRIPPFLLRMLAVGEETGEVDVMLARIADRYEEDLRKLIKRLLAVFEPIIIIILGILVGSIVLLMFLAMMGMQEVV